MDCAILFSDVSGSTSLYEILGDERAFALIGSCLKSMSACTTEAGGRVVKTIGDSVMAVFPTADAAAIAATEMQAAAEKLGDAGGTRVGLRIGFNFGPVVEKDGDVFGDAVNLAARVCDLASKGQIITVRETAKLLSRPFWPSLRELYKIPVKGKEEEVELLEVMWGSAVEDRTAVAAPPSHDYANQVLNLSLHDMRLSVGRERRKVTFGRDHEADFSIQERMVSRAHAMIERRRDKFILIDHSSNGTYVTVDGEPEALLRREEFVLRSHGWISFGQSRATSAEVVEFNCTSI